jgi:hypothetical protein
MLRIRPSRTTAKSVPLIGLSTPSGPSPGVIDFDLGDHFRYGATISVAFMLGWKRQ